jgi:hypothetical protein
VSNQHQSILKEHIIVTKDQCSDGTYTKNILFDNEKIGSNNQFYIALIPFTFTEKPLKTPEISVLFGSGRKN